MCDALFSGYRAYRIDSRLLNFKCWKGVSSEVAREQCLHESRRSRFPLTIKIGLEAQDLENEFSKRLRPSVFFGERNVWCKQTTVDRYIKIKVFCAARHTWLWSVFCHLSWSSIALLTANWFMHCGCNTKGMSMNSIVLEALASFPCQNNTGDVTKANLTFSSSVLPQHIG